MTEKVYFAVWHFMRSHTATVEIGLIALAMIYALWLFTRRARRPGWSLLILSMVLSLIFFACLIVVSNSIWAPAVTVTGEVSPEILEVAFILLPLFTAHLILTWSSRITPTGVRPKSVALVGFTFFYWLFIRLTIEHTFPLYALVD
jgi:hypothetical protein